MRRFWYEFTKNSWGRPPGPDPCSGEGYPSPLPCGASRHSFDRLVFPTRNYFYNFEPPLAKFPGCATAWANEAKPALPLTISSALCHANTCEMFPNVTTILKLLLLTPVTSSGVERANSSLRRIKDCFRSTMGEDRFNSLILLYVHNDIELNIDKIIDNFARKHPRRMLFLNPLGDRS